MLSKADLIMSIPSTNFSSYNLSQSVLLVAYSLMENLEMTKDEEKQNRASKKELFKFFDFLNSQLEDYYKIAKNPTSMQNNWQNIFNRAELSSSELKSLYGMIKTIAQKKL